MASCRSWTNGSTRPTDDGVADDRRRHILCAADSHEAPAAIRGLIRRDDCDASSSGGGTSGLDAARLGHLASPKTGITGRWSRLRGGGVLNLITKTAGSCQGPGLRASLPLALDDVAPEIMVRAVRLSRDFRRLHLTKSCPADIAGGGKTSTDNTSTRRRPFEACP